MGAPPPGRLVLVCGAKGGVGTTAVAANLAAAFGRNRRVLLVSAGGPSDDLDIWFPGNGKRTTGNLAGVVQAGAPELLDDAVEGRTEPPDLLRGELDPSFLPGLLRLAVARYPWVVVDCGHWNGVAGRRAAAEGVAAVTLVVTVPDPVAMRKAREAVDALAAGGRPIRCLLNRSTRNGRVAAGARDGGGDLPLLAELPEGPEMQDALLKGLPVVRSDPRSECAAGFMNLANAVGDFGAAAGKDEPAAAGDGMFRTAEFRRMRQRLHARFLERARERGVEAGGAVRGELARLVEEEGPPEMTPGFRARLLKELGDGVLGLGPLQDLLDDADVSEVMVNGPAEIYVERGGKIAREPRALDGEEELRAIIERIVAPLGRRIDEASPLVDARLADGSRVNAVIPPLAIKGSCLTIRKFAKKRLEVVDLVRNGSLTEDAAAFLREAVAGRLNMLISGGTGSGKTTLLNILASFIGAAERIVTVEDAAELRLPQDHVVSLEARPANLEGRGAITIRDLVRNTLRMRPDRIVVGEVRGGEALDMLQAMNTGHEGSLSTLHANTPRDALARLETMVLMAGMDLPLRAIREQVASAVEVVVQIARLKDGSRRVTQIAELCGLEGDVYRMQDIFVRRMDGGRIGELAPAGLVPRVAEKLAERGHALEPRIFAGTVR